MDAGARGYSKLAEEEVEEESACKDDGRQEEATNPLSAPEQDIDKFEYDSSTEILSHRRDRGGTVNSDRFLTSLISSCRRTYRMLCPSFAYFFSSYRSADPQSRVTPFAVVVLLVLLVIYIVNQADKLVLAVLIPSGLQCAYNHTSNNTCDPVTNTTLDVNASNSTLGEDCVVFDDTQQGLLTGPAFTLIYVVTGLPLAWLADTASRSLVLLIGLGFWSVAVFLTGFVKVFWQLLLLRMMLGIGEASCNPVAYSLLADFFPERNIAFALSVYHYGVYLGGAFGWMSGAINAALNWRWTFRTLGIVGMALIPLAVIALWEPKAVRTRRLARRKGKRTYRIKEVFCFLVKCPPFWMLLVAGSVRNIAGYALGYWLPTYYVRVFGLQSDEYGIKAGLAVLFGGGIGSFLGGLLADWFSRHKVGAKAFVISVSQLLAAPCIIGVLMVPSANASFGLLVLAYITAETWLGPGAAIVQDICMPAMRAQASAVYVGVVTVVASVGPVLVPLLLEVPAFAADCSAVRYALLCVVPTFYTVSSILFWILGIILHRWDRKQRRSENCQQDNCVENSREENEKSTKTEHHNVASDDLQPLTDSYQPLATDDEDDDGTKI